MTRAEAISHIKDVICENNTIKPNMVVFEQEKEALCMAIKALEQEPCKDAVSREDACHLYCQLTCGIDYCTEPCGDLKQFWELTSVQPKRPSIDDACKILSDALDAPCNYGLDGEEVCDIIPSEWCEDNCPNNEDYSICWKKYFEIKSADMRGEQT